MKFLDKIKFVCFFLFYINKLSKNSKRKAQGDCNVYCDSSYFLSGKMEEEIFTKILSLVKIWNYTSGRINNEQI